MSEQVFKIIPKLRGFLITYIIFSLPGFFMSVIFLGLTIFLILGLVFSSFSDPNNLKMVVSRESDNKDGVLIYDLSGAITSDPNGSGISVPKVEKDFMEIKKNPNIKNVVFRINSGGGEVFASQVLGDLMTDLSKSLNQTETVFYFNEVAASGALMATYSVPNNYVIAHPRGETGSIGVLLVLPNLTEAAEKIGYKQTVIKTGDLKNAGDIFQPTNGVEMKYFQTSVDKSFKDFKETVAKGRNINISEVEKIATGEFQRNCQRKEIN
jgi:protease-4